MEGVDDGGQLVVLEGEGEDEATLEGEGEDE